MPERYFSKLDLILTVHGAHLRTIGLEEDRVRRKHQGYNVERNLKVHIRVSSRQQLPRWIRNIELDGERARRNIDRIRGSRNRSREVAIRERNHVHERSCAWLDLAAEFLGHRDEHTHDIVLGNPE